MAGIDYMYTRPSILYLDKRISKDFKYEVFLDNYIEYITNNCNLITLSISDLKLSNGRILAISSDIFFAMKKRGFDTIFYKLWNRYGYKGCGNVNFLGFDHIVTYAKDKKKVIKNKMKEFKYDIFDYKLYELLEWEEDMEKEIIKIHILELTDRENVVCDPFINSQKVSDAAEKSGRSYLSLDKEAYLCL